MDLISSLTLTAESRPARRGAGRRPVAADPRQRERHLRVAAAKILGGNTTRWVASRYRVSARTVHYWVGLALSYDDPRSELLRSLAAAN